MTGVCDDGDIRLVGEDFYYGRVEVCTDNVWDTLCFCADNVLDNACFDQFDMDQAEAVCKIHLLKLIPEDSLGVYIAEVL